MEGNTEKNIYFNKKEIIYALGPTLIVLLRHSSATMRMSDSGSSHSMRKVSMAMPRNLGKSTTFLKFRKIEIILFEKQYLS